MDLSQLTYPLTVIFRESQYWIGKDGPYPCGAAATELLAGEDEGDFIDVKQELEVCLKTIGSHLNPYAAQEEDMEEIPQQAARNSATILVNYDYLPLEKTPCVVERCTFSSLRDFLYVELCRGISYGNAPRQCRLCGKWFFHEQGERALYCNRVAPGETEKTCREMGARSVFEKKLQNEDVWKIYKRAYKKYYARVMKGAMPRSEFDEWAKGAIKARDAASLTICTAGTAEEKAATVEWLRVFLNEK